MSYEEAPTPVCTASDGQVELVIRPKVRDLGEFSVRRVLPARERRMLGPFIFFDHMGPAEFAAGEGIRVRPHPHIGIATITYLFEGEIMHRDSLGFEQPIQAGAVNLMTAGRGIVHSERAGSDLDRLSRLHGIQSWIALPDGQEEIEAAFEHVPSTDIPDASGDGWRARVILGSAFGQTSPVTTYSPTVYAECQMDDGASLEVAKDADERALYVVNGDVEVDGQRFDEGAMIILCPDRPVTVKAHAESRLMYLGGAAVGKRHIFWNFVSSRRERIEQAKQEWAAGGFDRVDGDHEFIPLPG